MTEDKKSSHFSQQPLHEDQKLLVRILIAFGLIGATVLIPRHFVDSNRFSQTSWWTGMIVAYLMLQAIVIKILKARS